MGMNEWGGNEETIDTEGFKRSKNRSADDEAVGEGKRAGDKYHIVEPEAGPLWFPLSATKRDKAHGDASPSMATSQGRDSGVHGGHQVKTQGDGIVTARRSTCLHLVGRMGPRFSRLDPILTERDGLLLSCSIE